MERPDHVAMMVHQVVLKAVIIFKLSACGGPSVRLVEDVEIVVTRQYERIYVECGHCC